MMTTTTTGILRRTSTNLNKGDCHAFVQSACRSGARRGDDRVRRHRRDANRIRSSSPMRSTTSSRSIRPKCRKSAACWPASRSISRWSPSIPPIRPRSSGVLAESWTVSDDGKTFTFTMNPAAKFASGNPVTANDAEYSLRRVILIDSRISFILTQFGLTKDNVERQDQGDRRRDPASSKSTRNTRRASCSTCSRPSPAASSTASIVKQHEGQPPKRRQRLRQCLAEDREFGRLGPLRARPSGTRRSRS